MLSEASRGMCPYVWPCLILPRCSVTFDPSVARKVTSSASQETKPWNSVNVLFLHSVRLFNGTSDDPFAFATAGWSDNVICVIHLFTCLYLYILSSANGSFYRCITSQKICIFFFSVTIIFVLEKQFLKAGAFVFREYLYKPSCWRCGHSTYLTQQ